MLKVYLDMDQVVCDMVEPLKTLLGKQDAVVEQVSLEEALGFDKPYMQRLTDYTRFWRDLPELPEGMRLYRGLLNLPVELKFLSYGWNTASKIGKRRWLDDRGMPQTLILAKHKDKYAYKDSVLIDDMPYNVEPFSEAGGKALLYPAPWNKSELNVDAILETVGNLT